MSTKRRIHQVAKEFNVSNEALISFLAEVDFEAHSPMTALPEELYEQVLKKFYKAPVAKDADYEFRKHIRDKKLEEEKERERARHQYEERMRVATQIMEERVQGAATRKKEGAAEKTARTGRVTKKVEPIGPAPEVTKAAPKRAGRGRGEVVDGKPVEVAARGVSEPAADVKHVPSLQEAIVSLIPQEDLHPAAPSAEPAARETTPAKPAKSDKDKPAEKVTAAGEAAKKRKKRRRRRKKAGTGEVGSTVEEESSAVSARPKEKEKYRAVQQELAGKQRIGAKKKKRKKRKISEEEIEESIRQTLAAMEGPGKPRARRRKDRDEVGEEVVDEENKIRVPEFISAADLSRYLNVDPSEVIRKCLSLGMIVSINQRLDSETIVTVSDEFGYDAEIVEEYSESDGGDEKEAEEASALQPRPPVVTIMGHVDHGKTSLLDYLRKSNITAGESGGITQHIGAYEVTFNNRAITFLDTPGHEAFTAMRARGAQATDIVILVVAADDGVQQQTLEAVSHARAANVPMVIAINKIDKSSANPDNLKKQLAQHGVLVESWGGKIQSAEISAKTGKGIEHLLELVLLEADLLDLKANPTRRAKGVVVEAELDRGKGPLATVLVQAGTLHVGEPFLAGQVWGKVRAMYDEHGRRVHDAPPSRPVRVVGFSGVPSAGDTLGVMASEQEAKEISLKRQQLRRAQGFHKARHMTLDQLSQKVKEGEVKELRIIVKADVDGSVEALGDSLLKLSTNEVAVKVIHKGVGGISESDVLLAAASDAVVFGFHVRATQQARETAERESVDIRMYKIIYDAVNDVKAALEGMLEPEISEQITASVAVRETFKIPKIGTIAGCYVQTGKVNRNDNVRLYRNDRLIHEGKIASLKRFKDDVREVASGFECGLALAGYDDIHVGDVVESFQVIKTKRTLVAAT
ncbi:MAG: translation initiation factor IF-2 [bacterium]